MREFFHGWRRKAGCVTLVMALAVASMWMRSHVMADDLYFTVGDRRHHLRSAYCQVFWGGWPAEAGGQQFHRSSDRIADLEAEDFNWGRFWFREMPPNHAIHWGLPYSYVMLPLTLLSAYLILWKPGQAPKPADPGIGFSQRHQDTEPDTNNLTDNSHLPSVTP